MHLKWKVRKWTIQIEFEKVGFACEKIKFFNFFFEYCLKLKAPKNFGRLIFSIIWKTYTKIGFLGPGKYQKEQIRNFAYGSPDLVTVADGFMVRGP